MRFWDASAIVPLLVAQPRSAAARSIRNDDSMMAVWWGSSVECVSAIARLVRENAIERAAAAIAFERLHALEDEWAEVEPSSELRNEAQQLLRAHPLRAADALQLASAMRLASEMNERVQIVCFDTRLADAARAERLVVVS